MLGRERLAQQSHDPRVIVVPPRRPSRRRRRRRRFQPRQGLQLCRVVPLQGLDAAVTGCRFSCTVS